MCAYEYKVHVLYEVCHAVIGMVLSVSDGHGESSNLHGASIQASLML